MVTELSLHSNLSTGLIIVSYQSLTKFHQSLQSKAEYLNDCFGALKTGHLHLCGVQCTNTEKMERTKIDRHKHSESK